MTYEELRDQIDEWLSHPENRTVDRLADIYTRIEAYRYSWGSNVLGQYFMRELDATDRLKLLSKVPRAIYDIDQPSQAEQDVFLSFLIKARVFAKKVTEHFLQHASQKTRQKVVQHLPQMVPRLPNVSERELTQAILFHPAAAESLISRIPGQIDYKLLALTIILGRQRGTAHQLPYALSQWTHAMRLWGKYWHKVLGITT